ncbi:MAG: GntR family transcriptional regulator [Christensenellales bacterium]
MYMDFDSDMPIYIQVAEELENAILSGASKEGTQVPSTTEISVRYKINPATALKGISKLADDGILYKKRGIGMFVAKGAKEKLKLKRKQLFFESYVMPLISEANKLSIERRDIEEMIKRGFEK